MIVYILLLSLLYLWIGAGFSFALYRLYIKADERNGDGYNDKSYYCVFIGLFWPVAAPFAFALFFAKYGFPKHW